MQGFIDKIDSFHHDLPFLKQHSADRDKIAEILQRFLFFFPGFSCNFPLAGLRKGQNPDNRAEEAISCYFLLIFPAFPLAFPGPPGKAAFFS